MEQTIMHNPRWYSTVNVLSHFHSDIGYPLPDNSKIIRKAEELYIASIVSKGMEELTKQKSWIQPVSDEEQSPDVRAIVQIESAGNKANNYAQIDLEIVNYEHSPNENLIQFLLRTKFSGTKSYDEKTTIVLRVKEKTLLPPEKEWASSLKNSRCKSPVIILGRTNPIKPEYTITQVYPEYKELININLLDVVKNTTDNVGTINFKRGTKKLETLSRDELHCPFENLGIKCCVKLSSKNCPC
jgi:hypothetical protein